MKKKLVLGIFFSLLLLSTGCTQHHADNHKHEASIDYNNQKEWKFTAGDMQSPINISTKHTVKMDDDIGKIMVNYDPVIEHAENNGHSIQVTKEGTALINGRHFALSQFHFHAQSEHTINNKHYPIEVHFVNKSQSGRLAVIAVFFEQGKENKGFQEVLDDVNNAVNDPITDILTMLPENKSYYHYLGSLTTPPLIENVEWYVMKNPVQVSKKQISDFKKLYKHNNRKIQPLKDRTIVSYDE